MFKRFFSRQARQPSGWFGRIIATRVFDKGNKAVNSAMADMVAAHGGEAFLEIGFGGGNVIQEVADRLGDAVVEGIDFSDAMLDVARKRNKRHIENGRVKLVHGDFDAARYSASSFDSVCSANTIYFWPEPAGTCARIFDVLKPGGLVVLAFVDKSKMESMPLDMEVFRPVSRDSVKVMLEDAGFKDVTVLSVEDEDAAYCVTGVK